MGSPDNRESRARLLLRQAAEHHRIGNLEDADREYRHVLELWPNNFDAMHMLGALALQSDRPDRARELIGRALLQNPHSAAAYGNLALAFVRLERWPEAIESYQRQIALRPEDLAAHVHLAAAFARTLDFETALEVCERAARMHPTESRAQLARAVALKDLGDLAGAIAACDRAIELQPDLAAAWDKRGAALRDADRKADALESVLTALALERTFALAQEHAGMMYLQAGNFELGWKFYEGRRLPGGGAASLPRPQRRWTGRESLRGETIILHSEQGLGDVIQFSRYALMVESLGAHVIVSVPRCLSRLMRSLSASITVVSQGEAEPVARWECPLMSLPYAFGTTVDTIPCTIPFLTAEADRVERWRDALGEGFKIGICWQGRLVANDVGRSFPLNLCEPLSLLDGVRLISLQKGAGVEQLANTWAQANVEQLSEAFDSDGDAFIDTAAIMESLDLIITIDSAIGHLAGALGRRTWVALKHVPDWRWLDGRTDSPWYPSHRLFRQKYRGDWHSVFERMRLELAQLAQASR